EIPRFPFVPADPLARDERCYEAYNIQIHGLMKRLQSTELERVVIGISGGLDSTQALIVAAKAMDRMKLPRQNILAYTMPGFATSTHTLNNARKLMAVLKVTANEIDIRPGCEQMLRDISHPYSTGSVDYDVTFENVQAGQRTALLFRLANLHRGLVLGTSDLSELALGWATYGIGDHMSHYNVNVSVPKTLMQYLIRWVIASRQFDEATSAVLQSVVDTEFSPELVPHTGGDTTKPAQLTAEKIGPYDLQDFNLYYITRYGFRPSKVAFLSYHAWGDKDRGRWLDSIPKEKRRDYGLTEIKTWLELFLYRFFKISQFKRSALPNGPKLGSGGSLSPRSDWRAPSDSEAIVWLEELRKNVPL
ncbi:MAG: NAD(+) synthase, partial [Limisphaerales bacterium]